LIGEFQGRSKSVWKSIAIIPIYDKNEYEVPELQWFTLLAVDNFEIHTAETSRKSSMDI